MATRTKYGSGHISVMGGPGEEDVVAKVNAIDERIAGPGGKFAVSLVDADGALHTAMETGSAIEAALAAAAMALSDTHLVRVSLLTPGDEAVGKTLMDLGNPCEVLHVWLRENGVDNDMAQALVASAYLNAKNIELARLKMEEASLTEH